MTQKLLPTFQLWIQSLLYVNEKPKNREAMLDILFAKYANKPNEFQQLLRFMRRHMRHVNPRLKRTKKLADQCLHVISPLAERLGMYREKEALDSACLQIVDVKRYRDVEQTLEAYNKKSSSVIISVRKILKKVLQEAGFEVEIYGRFKRLHSIVGKMDRKRYGHPLKLYDIFAFRIIIEDPDPKQCFEVLNVLHDQFTPIAQRFKDYVSIPKINGYQSIHTCLTDVVQDLDLPFEVQIRTSLMHSIAQEGVAAHWMYSLKSKRSMHSLLFIDQYADAVRKVREAEQQHIYFFTPKGDVLTLPEGSTALDAAFCIHTNLAMHAKKVRINNKEQPFSYVMQAGDYLEIVSGSEKQICEDWLQYSTNPVNLKKLYAAL